MMECNHIDFILTTIIHNGKDGRLLDGVMIIHPSDTQCDISNCFIRQLHGNFCIANYHRFCSISASMYNSWVKKFLFIQREDRIKNSTSMDKNFCKWANYHCQMTIQCNKRRKKNPPSPSLIPTNIIFFKLSFHMINILGFFTVTAVGTTIITITN